MANTNLFIGINHGDAGMNDADFSIQSTTNAGKDFEFRANAVDANSNVTTRLDMLIALKAIIQVIESDGTNTTDLNQ